MNECAIQRSSRHVGVVSDTCWTLAQGLGIVVNGQSQRQPIFDQSPNPDQVTNNASTAVAGVAMVKIGQGHVTPETGCATAIGADWHCRGWVLIGELTPASAWRGKQARQESHVSQSRVHGPQGLGIRRWSSFAGLPLSSPKSMLGSRFRQLKRKLFYIRPRTRNSDSARLPVIDSYWAACQPPHPTQVATRPSCQKEYGLVTRAPSDGQ